MDWINKEAWDAEKEFYLEKEWEWHLFLHRKSKDDYPFEDFKKKRVEILKADLEYKYKIDFNLKRE